MAWEGWLPLPNHAHNVAWDIPYVKPLAYPMRMGYAYRMARSKKAEQTYEEAGKRPGKPISTRLSDEEMKVVDKLRGKTSRSAWLIDLIRREMKRKSRG